MVEIASQEIHRHAKGKKMEKDGCKSFSELYPTGAKLRLGKFCHRMLANCYKIGTMRSVKAVGKIRRLLTRSSCIGTATEVTGIFRRSTQAIDGMVHMCSIGVFVAVHCPFSVIGCNFLHANAYPSRL